MFRERGVRLIAVNDGFDSASGEDDFTPFREIMAEFYAKDISRKIRSVRATSAKQGKFMGSKPPFGYVKSSDNKHKLVIDPPAAEIVKRLYREFACGESGRSIAAKLNAEGVDTPAVYYYKQTGKRATRGDNCQQWGSATITQLLRNHVYIGHMAQGKRKVSSFKTKKRLSISSDDWVVVENTHNPIIDEYTWDDVQQRMAKARSTPSNGTIRRNSMDEVSLFSGIIRCADCGAAMIFNRKIRKSGAEKHFYRCSRYTNNGSASCTTHIIDIEVLESVILHDIQHHAKTAIQDEQGLLNRLFEYSGAAHRNENATFFKYPPEIRKLIYTTNMIESYHRQLRKVTKGKVVFPTDEALLKMLYLVTQDVLIKWTGRIHNWGQILLQLSVFFPDRVKSFLR
jgi:hypothetical protein